MAAGDSYAAGNTGGANNISINTTTGGHIITQEELPSRTLFSYNMTDSPASSGSGISWGSVTKSSYVATCNQDTINQWEVQTLQNYQRTERKQGINFDASRSWTGETFSVGCSGETFSNLPPYLAVVVWRRVA